jgi:hypothetical protein
MKNSLCLRLKPKNTSQAKDLNLGDLLSMMTPKAIKILKNLHKNQSLKKSRNSSLQQFRNRED